MSKKQSKPAKGIPAKKVPVKPAKASAKPVKKPAKPAPKTKASVKAKPAAKAAPKAAAKAPQKAAAKAPQKAAAKGRPTPSAAAKNKAQKPAAKAGKPAPKPKAAAKPAAAKKAPAKPVAKPAPAKPAAKQAAPAKAAAKKPVAAPVKAAPAAKAAKAAKAPPPKAAKKAVLEVKAPEPVPAAPVEAAPVEAAPQTAKRQLFPPLPPGPAANGAIYYDTHMHTPLCKHAWGEPEEYAAQGIKAGLKGIIFTCHCPMPDGFWPTVRMADSEFDTYVDMVNRAAKAYKGKLDVRLGLESEFFPGMEKWIEELHQRADFDYIVGGVHWQAREYLAKYETGTIEAFRKCYFNHLAESAETGLYDCLAHPDLVKNYHPDSWCLAIVKGSIASALDRIAATGVAMELNTSGLNKSYSEMNPGLEMLKMMADRGIPIVVGSDAHRPQRVGEHFMTALNHLQEAGYSEVSYFLNRKRVDLKISAVLASIKKAADAQAG